MTDIWIRPHHIIIEVENKNCRVLKKCSSFGLNNLKVTDIRALKNSIRHLVEIGGNQTKKIPKDITQRIVKGKNKNTYSFWFDSKGCEVCETILSHAAFLISGKSSEKYIIRYNFIVPTFKAFNDIISSLKKRGYKIRILKKGTFEPKPGILTEKQEKIFWLLFKGGFFEYPRKVNLQELSNKIGTSPSSLSEMIRRGTRRLLEEYFERKTA